MLKNTLELIPIIPRIRIVIKRVKLYLVHKRHNKRVVMIVQLNQESLVVESRLKNINDLDGNLIYQEMQIDDILNYCKNRDMISNENMLERKKMIENRIITDIVANYFKEFSSKTLQVSNHDHSCKKQHSYLNQFM